MSVLKINGVEPSLKPLKNGYRITKSDIYSDSTGRSAETGHLLAYPVRKNIHTIELEFLGTDSEIAEIENLIDDTSLSVTFLDNGTEKTCTMYPSDRVKSVEVIQNGIARQRLSFSLIEY